MKISDQLENKIIRFIEENPVILTFEPYEISPEDLEIIWEKGRDGVYEASDSLLDANFDYRWQSEDFFLGEIVFQEFYDELSAEKVDFEDFKLYFQEYVIIDTDIVDELLSANLRLNITFEEFNCPGYLWRSEVEHNDLEYALRTLRINPKEIDETWPNIPYDNPGMDGEKFAEILDNTTTGCGSFCFCVEMTAEKWLEAEEKGINKGITISAGTYLTIWDRINGSCSIEHPIENEITILSDYHITEDRLSGGYGLDEICGLVSDYWAQGSVEFL